MNDEGWAERGRDCLDGYVKDASVAPEPICGPDSKKENVQLVKAASLDIALTREHLVDVGDVGCFRHLLVWSDCACLFGIESTRV